MFWQWTPLSKKNEFICFSTFPSFFLSFFLSFCVCVSLSYTHTLSLSNLYQRTLTVRGSITLQLVSSCGSYCLTTHFRIQTSQTGEQPNIYTSLNGDSSLHQHSTITQSTISLSLQLSLSLSLTYTYIAEITHCP